MDAVEKCLGCSEPAAKHHLCRVCLKALREQVADEIRELRQRLVAKQSQLDDLA